MNLAITLSTSTSAVMSLATCSQSLREECAYIESHPNVVPGSILLYAEDGIEMVKLDIRYEECNVPAESRLINPEPIVLIYPQGKAGEKAPKILSDRIDFPRNVPHLNPVNDNSPCSICISRSGIQPLYDVLGILGTISQLVSWFEDTQAGCSQHDGWEPTPRGGIPSVSLNIGAMQRYITTKSKMAGISYGKCRLIYDAENENINVLTYVLSDKAIKELSPDKTRFSLSKKYTKPHNDLKLYFFGDIPVVCIWASDDAMVSYHQATLINSVESLRSYAQQSGHVEALAYFENEVIGHTNAEDILIREALLILAQRRPLPMIPDIPSDATGDDRHVELIPLAIRITPERSPRIESVQQCDTLAGTTNKLLADTSGLSHHVEKVTVAGGGALGSSLILQLGKGGAEHVTVVDDKYFMPHNVARHTLGTDAIGYKKGRFLKHMLEKQLPITIAAKNKKLQELSSKELDKICDQGLLIDCTAELSTSRFAYKNDTLPRLLKAEIAYEGHLGILALEGERHNPCIQDIKACLFKRAVDIPHIQRWLSSERQQGSVVTGQSCSSATMTMPNYVVTGHTSSFMPKIHAAISASNSMPGLGINMLDESYCPLGWEWMDIPPFEVFCTNSRNGNWDVRIHQDAIGQFKELSLQYAPREAGGFLYGTYDRVNRSISIVHQISPITAKHRNNSITLPVAGETSEEKDWFEKTAGVLPLVGTWHSHVNQSSSPSSTDNQRMTEAEAANVLTPAPFVVLIVGSDGISPHVVLPQNW